MWCIIHDSSNVIHVFEFAVLDLTIACSCPYHCIDLVRLIRFVKLRQVVVFPESPAKDLLPLVFLLQDVVVGLVPTPALVEGQLHFDYLGALVTVSVSPSRYLDRLGVNMYNLLLRVGECDCRVEDLAHDCGVLVPLDSAHVLVTDHLVITPLWRRVGLLFADNELVDPFGRPDPDVARTDEPHWISVNCRDVFTVHFIRESDFIGRVKSGLNRNGDLVVLALEVSVVGNRY